jgi:hypothetical protein
MTQKKIRAKLVKRKVAKYIAPEGFVYDLKVGGRIRTRSIGYKLGKSFVRKINKSIIEHEKAIERIKK